MVEKLQIPGHSEFVNRLNDKKIPQEKFSCIAHQEKDKVVLLPSIKRG
jgi:hypothetical protein